MSNFTNLVDVGHQHQQGNQENRYIQPGMLLNSEVRKAMAGGNVLKTLNDSGFGSATSSESSVMKSEHDTENRNPLIGGGEYGNSWTPGNQIGLFPPGIVGGGKSPGISLRRRKLQNSGESQINHFNRLQVPDEIVAKIFSFLPKVSLVKSMDVCRKWRTVASEVTVLWERLDLGNRKLTDYQINTIINRGVRILRLFRADIILESRQLMANARVQPCRLTHLDLSLAQYSSPIIPFSIIRRCNQLQCLSLEFCIIDENVCRAIGNNRHLETLNLSMARGLNLEGIQYISNGCIGLVELNLGWTDMTRPMYSYLVNNLAGMRLHALNLSGGREAALHDDDAQALAENLSELKVVDLSDCAKISVAGMDHILSLSSLEGLHLSRCYAIEPMSFTRCGNLKHLCIFGCVTEAGFETLQAKLKHVKVNKEEMMFSAIARPTTGIRRTSIWCQRVRDENI